LQKFRAKAMDKKTPDECLHSIGCFFVHFFGESQTARKSVIFEPGSELLQQTEISLAQEPYPGKLLFTATSHTFIGTHTCIASAQQAGRRLMHETLLSLSRLPISCM